MTTDDFHEKQQKITFTTGFGCNQVKEDMQILSKNELETICIRSISCTHLSSKNWTHYHMLETITIWVLTSCDIIRLEW